MCSGYKNTTHNTKDYFWKKKNRSQFLKGRDKDKYENCKNNLCADDYVKKCIIKENFSIIKKSFKYKINDQYVNMIIDSGAKRNFISIDLVNEL